MLRRDDALDQRPRIERFSISDVANLPFDGFRQTYAERWHAITIGPDSILDRCWIIPPTELGQALSGSTLSTVRTPFGPKAIAVSVERPFVGEIDGPVTIFAPFAESVDSDRRWVSGFNNTVFSASADTFFPQYAFPYLDLQFWTCAPAVLPSARAPLTGLIEYLQVGTTGVLGDTIRLPGYGRRRLSLSLRMTGRSAGDITWSLAGINFARHATRSPLSISHTLQSSLVEAVDFQRTYFFDGEFDNYALTFAEGAALNAGVTFDVIYKLWDTP
jgi:hypothetical protein